MREESALGIFIFIIIQVHHVTCTLGLLSHVAPCIKTENRLKRVKSSVLMIESTQPQLLDGFANINIPACLIQYHYYLLLGHWLQSESHSPTPSYIQSTTASQSLSCMLHIFTAKNVLHPLFSISPSALSTDPLLTLQTISSRSLNSLYLLLA